MGRNKHDHRLDTIVQYVQQHPDHKAGAIAKALGLDNKTLTRALAQLEDRGDLLAEDDKGRLRWFGWRRS